MHLPRLAATAFVLVFAANAIAHDYWLQPKRFRMGIGESVPVQLFVGDHFDRQSERPLQMEMTVRLQLLSADNAVDLKSLGKEGDKPITTIVPKSPGAHLLTLERDWAEIEIEAAKFNGYLEHEGLKDILKRRKELGEFKKSGTERYRRYLKSLVEADSAKGDVYKRKLGHRLEILPGANPAQAKVGDTIPVTILFEGKPLPNTLVTAYSRAGTSVSTQETRTNSRGQVDIKIKRKGEWLVRLVHMQRCKEPKFDWESFWAAYSFEVR